MGEVGVEEELIKTDTHRVLFAVSCSTTFYLCSNLLYNYTAVRDQSKHARNHVNPRMINGNSTLFLKIVNGNSVILHGIFCVLIQFRADQNK